MPFECMAVPQVQPSWMQLAHCDASLTSRVIFHHKHHTRRPCHLSPFCSQIKRLGRVACNGAGDVQLLFSSWWMVWIKVGHVAKAICVSSLLMELAELLACQHWAAHDRLIQAGVGIRQAENLEHFGLVSRPLNGANFLSAVGVKWNVVLARAFAKLRTWASFKKWRPGSELILSCDALNDRPSS